MHIHHIVRLNQSVGEANLGPYSAYTLLIGKPMPSLRLGGLLVKVFNELSETALVILLGSWESSDSGSGIFSSSMVAAILCTLDKLSRCACVLEPLLKDQRRGITSAGTPPP